MTCKKCQSVMRLWLTTASFKTYECPRCVRVEPAVQLKGPSQQEAEESFRHSIARHLRINSVTLGSVAFWGTGCPA
jgi:hypothetical protein